MSHSDAASTSQRPRLAPTAKFGGWAWPRLVDIPTTATRPSSRRSSSARSHTGAIHASERDPAAGGSPKRAASVHNQQSSALPLTDGAEAANLSPPNPGDDVTTSEVSSEALEHVHAAPSEKIEASPALDTTTAPPLTSLPVLEMIKLVPSSSTVSSEIHTDPELASLRSLPLSPISEPAQESSLEESEEALTLLLHPISNLGSGTFMPPDLPPRPVSVFRALPTDSATTPTSALLPSDVLAPFHVSKLPPPQILIIRASSDSTQILDRTSASTPDLPDAIGGSATATSQSGGFPGVPGVPGVPNVPYPSPGRPLSMSGLIPEDLGAVKVPVVSQPKKGKKMIRKTRKLFLRSPVLTIILGRQLALLARPALKIIAGGGELPAMAIIGQGIDTAGAPLGASGVPVDAMGAPASAVGV